MAECSGICWLVLLSCAWSAVVHLPVERLKQVLAP